MGIVIFLFAFLGGAVGALLTWLCGFGPLGATFSGGGGVLIGLTCGFAFAIWRDSRL
jgi:hypothetical protein